MASANVAEWIAKNIGHAGTDVLELGSKRYKEHAYLDLRNLLIGKGKEINFTGCDMAAGENVDIVLDLTASFDQIEAALGGRRFDTVFCISLLEHIPDVFGACRNIAQLLRPGGAIFISVPFIFRYHGYPGDLWRFTPEAVCYLFPGIDFQEYRYSSVSTLEEGDTLSLRNRNMEKMNRFLFRPKSREEKLERKRNKLEGGDVPAYSLAPAMINMIGFKK
ncbi:methyltransferase domain-containing protein [Azoarcus sp. L1K30]|uniref:class I SAM-dependent methyltransferase n=1 Tax=Azoarcus sp. L1K30 TaxID=2820277 RepID=UPI001B818BCD|nr:methyltransferase domain-containing protein [Azoarcus sp. L1K30]MBR0566014.1 methyltransferase domain-containing protein [Azoarcus sp. L1K30]